MPWCSFVTLVSKVGETQERDSFGRMGSGNGYYDPNFNWFFRFSARSEPHLSSI